MLERDNGHVWEIWELRLTWNSSKQISHDWFEIDLATGRMGSKGCGLLLEWSRTTCFFTSWIRAWTSCMKALKCTLRFPSIYNTQTFHDYSRVFLHLKRQQLLTGTYITYLTATIENIHEHCFASTNCSIQVQAFGYFHFLIFTKPSVKHRSLCGLVIFYVIVYIFQALHDLCLMVIVHQLTPHDLEFNQY